MPLKTAKETLANVIPAKSGIHNLLKYLDSHPPINTFEGRLCGSDENPNTQSFLKRILACFLVVVFLGIGALEAAEDSVASVERWWAPGGGQIFPKSISYENSDGIVTTLNQKGPTDTKGHPFFTAYGKNGRACVTCHQPVDGMSISIDSIKKRWHDTQGQDPLFAAIDGSNCPSLPQEKASSHSLLLKRGLFRVFLPWPPKNSSGERVEPQFTIDVVRDPTRCNTDPIYGLTSDNPTISVYRRPRPATNLKYLTAAGFPFEPKTGLPLIRDPKTGELISGNLMADGRVGTLKDQAIDAFLTHLEADIPTEEQLNRIIEFETSLYTAQSVHKIGGDLTADGAKGGPETLMRSKPGVLNSSRSFPIWDEFESWLALLENPVESPSEQRKFRESVARGVKLFRERTFLITDNAGINSMNFGNPVRNDCNFCHNMYRFGNDVAPGQVDLGTTNEPFADPSPGLPLFKLTCKSEYPPHPFLGRVVFTHDPGFALTTGKCIDIGKITMQSMRGMASRPPFFSDGSSATIRDVVDYYERRYNMQLTEQEKQDLTNLMSVL